MDDLNRLESEEPLALIKRNVKFVDEGALVTSGGISTGINLSFPLLSRLHEVDVAKATAKRMDNYK